MKNVIFIAPPAAGKGTQSSKLETLGFYHISTGDMLREEIATGSALGDEINKLISQGDLVGDEIVFELISNKIKSLDKPFILDGFPRTMNQVKMLNNLFEELNINNYEVIYLDIELEDALKRTLGRLTCKCGASYNLYNDEFKPKVEGICDKCGSQLQKRNDDNENSFRVRFDNYIKNTAPIIEYYNNIGKLHKIDTKLSNDEITDKIKEILND